MFSPVTIFAFRHLIELLLGLAALGAASLVSYWFGRSFDRYSAGQAEFSEQTKKLLEDERLEWLERVARP